MMDRMIENPKPKQD